MINQNAKSFNIDKKYLYSTIALFIVFVTFAIYSYFKLQNQIVSNYLIKLSQISRTIEIKINLYFTLLEDKLKLINQSPVVKEFLKRSASRNENNNEIIRDYLKNTFSNFGLKEFIILERDKILLAYHNDVQHSINPFSQLQSINEIFNSNSDQISDLTFDSDLKRPVFYAHSKINIDENLDLKLYLTFDANESFYKLLEFDNTNEANLEAVLLKIQNDEMIYISNSRFLGDIAFRLKTSSSKHLNGELISNEREKFFEISDYRGKKVYAYYTFIPRWNWFLVVKVDNEDAIRQAKKFYFSIFGTIIFVTAVFLISVNNIFKKEKGRLLKETNELKRQKELISKKYDYVTRLANDAIIISDNQNRIIDFNERFVEMYHINLNQNDILKLNDIFTETLQKQWLDYVKTIKSNNGLIFETIHKKMNGEVFNVQVSAKFIEIDGNEYLIQLVRNFEERKRIENELIAAKQKAEESDRLKSNFLSMMSHEVRTPVNIILGAVDILKSSLRDDMIKETEHLFDMITRNGKRLLTLISDIIDISRIESNELKLEFIIRNAESIILDVISEYEQTAKNKGLQIITNFQSTNPYIRIDEVRFIQIITNLLTNAIKFTSQGGITISTKNVDDSLHISVKDTGIGIPKSALKDIFGLFRQAHEGYSRNFEGAGLGLTITQKLTKMMGGEIFVESEENVGSTFTVVFPVIKSDEIDEKLLNDLQNRKRDYFVPTILIVNNNKDESFYLESLMIRLGFDYYSINEGKKIISLLKHKTFDCILYSINPENELEAEKTIDEIRNKNRMENLRIIALRSPNSILTHQRLLELGFDLVKDKPVSFEEISKAFLIVLTSKK